MIVAALIILLATLLKKGLITALARTRIVKALVRVLFNYDLGNKKAKV